MQQYTGIADKTKFNMPVDDTPIHPHQDRGYAWVILGSAMLTMYIHAIVWSQGVFHVIFLENMEATNAEVALVTSLCASIFCFIGPISGALTDKLGNRVVAVIGSVIGSLGVILSAFATNIYFLYISYGLLAGGGFGLGHVPILTVTSEYFKKYRGIALALSATGLAVGLFVIPPLINQLDFAYGWRGALLILGGICMHTILCGLLWRPMESDNKKASVPCDCVAPASVMVNSNGYEADKRLDGDETVCCHQFKRRHIKESSNREESASLNMVGDDTVYRKAGYELNNEMHIQARVKLKSVSNDCSSNNTVIKTGKSCSCQSEQTLMMKFLIFKNVDYCMFCLSSLLLGMGTTVGSTHMVAFATSIGLSRTDAVTIISVFGASSFCGRLIIGGLLQVPPCNALNMYVLSFTIGGVCLLIFPSCPGFWSMACDGAVYGLFYSGFGFLMPAVAIQLVGVETLSIAYGMLLLFCAIGILAGGPLSGWVYDTTDYYAASLYLGGACLLLCAFVMIPAVWRSLPCNSSI